MKAPRAPRIRPDAEAAFPDARAAAAFLAQLLAQPGIPGADLELRGAGRRLRLRLRVEPPPRLPGAPAPVPVARGLAGLAALVARLARENGAPVLPAAFGVAGVEHELAELLEEARSFETDLRGLLPDLEAESLRAAEGRADPVRLNRALRLRVGLEGLVG